jgi:hypothetical protein
LAQDTGATSDEPKRIFSGGRHLVSWERMSLELGTVQFAECLMASTYK